MDFYTSVMLKGNQILVCGYKGGKRFRSRVNYKPYLFIKSNKQEAKYKTISGQPVEKIAFDSVAEARDFVKKYTDVDNFEIYGLTNYVYTYIHDTYPQIKYDSKLIKTAYLDIEVATDEKYPDIQLADTAITAITLMYNDISFVFGYGDFKPTDSSVKYFKCKDEIELLNRFITVWTSDLYRPDVVSGWNIEFFDIPYCINRIRNLLGDSYAKKLSPWNYYDERVVPVFGKDVTVYHPAGINVLDYYQLYRKFTYSQQESFKLDHIAFIELGQRKLDYSEYESLASLYKNDHQKFMEYNVRDCMLVRKLDDKMKLLDLVYTFAYDSGVNYVDALTTVRSWDVIIHNYLLDRKIVVPQKPTGQVQPDRTPAGAHVKDPQVGFHNWVVSFDVQSLYPHLIMGYNISPDTFRGKHRQSISVDQLLDGAASTVDQYCKQHNVSFAANGCFYTKQFQGFLPTLMQELFEKRKTYKNKMLELKKQQQSNDSVELANQITMYDNLQMAAKIKLNSAFGATANPFFRWFDFNYAESITVSGQLTIRWAERQLNKFLNQRLNTVDVDYCVASDTDSLYLDLERYVKTLAISDSKQIVQQLDSFCQQEIQPYLDQIFQQLSDYMNCYKQMIYMKREGISDRGIFVAKKRYILNVYNNEGVQYDKPKLKMMGIEAVRSSTPASCRQSIKNILEVILTQGETQTIEFIERFRQEFSNLPFEDVAFPRSVNNLDKYQDSVTVYKKATPIHVRGALLYNRLLHKHKLTNKYSEIFDKEKIKFCYLTLPNPLGENVISVPQVLPKQFGLDKYIDYDKMFEKAFLEPIETILNVVGWKSKKITTLEGFFT